MKPFAVEKDWWVSRTLEIIFQMPIAEHLVFKGQHTPEKWIHLDLRWVSISQNVSQMSQ
jgi:hypothetical protein